MGKRGRPAFEPTADQRKKVQQLSVDGHSVVDIARLVKISKPVLTRVFAEELISGKKIRTAPKTPPLKFKITKAMRARVSRLIGAKMTVEEVAVVFGCTKEQLEENFADEIRTGEIHLRARAIDDLVHQSGLGKTAATNQLMAITAPVNEMANQPAPAGTAGKKAALTANAQRVAASGGRFAPPAAPTLVVNNDKK
jgi:hypothetical protein